MKSLYFVLFLLLAGCASVPCPASAQVEITKDCRNPSTEVVTYGKTTDITLAKNEKRCLFLKSTSTSCLALPKGVKAFEARTITTTLPSWNGGKLGDYIDPLIPVDCISNKAPTLIEVSSDADAVTRIGDATINVKKLELEMPLHPKRPVMVAAPNWFGVKLLCNGVWCSRETFVAVELNKIIQDHFMTPYDHHVIAPPVVNGKLNLTAPVSGMSANDTWLKYRHTDFIFIPNVAWGQDTSPTFITYLKAVEATIQEQGWQGKAWMYVEDEPQGFGTMDRTIRKLKDIRANAPSLKTMVTITPNASNAQVTEAVSMTDYPVIINSHFTVQPTAKDFWMYLSCESHGCGNNRAWTNLVRGNPGDDLKISDWGAIERPSSFIRSFTWLMVKYQTKAGLYFNSVEHANIFPAVDPFKDVFNWGGNGDGVLVYSIIAGKEGMTKDSFIPSLRLKLISEAIQDMFYLEQMNATEKAEFDQIVVNNKIFSTGYSHYEAFIGKIKNRLAGGVVVPTPTPVPPTPTISQPSPTVIPTPTPMQDEEVELSITVKCVKRGKSMVCK